MIVTFTAVVSKVLLAKDPETVIFVWRHCQRRILVFGPTKCQKRTTMKHDIAAVSGMTGLQAGSVHTNSESDLQGELPSSWHSRMSLDAKAFPRLHSWKGANSIHNDLRMIMLNGVQSHSNHWDPASRFHSLLNIEHSH